LNNLDSSSTHEASKMPQHQLTAVNQCVNIYLDMENVYFVKANYVPAMTISMSQTQARPPASHPDMAAVKLVTLVSLVSH